MNKRHAPACERNRDPILAVLAPLLASRRRLLEIGSGTGQHAVYFAERLPNLIWQTSELPDQHPSILAWMEEARLDNVLPPLKLDVSNPEDWPRERFDAVFSANTSHIMAWESVEHMFRGIGRILDAGGLLCIYGPFNVGGRFTSESNAAFDAMLRRQSPHMGLRDLEQVDALAQAQGLRLQDNHAMPANNRLLVWRREGVPATA